MYGLFWNITTLKGLLLIIQLMTVINNFGLRISQFWEFSSNPISPLSDVICPRNGCPTNCRTILDLGFLSFGLFSNPLSPLSDKICPRNGCPPCRTIWNLRFLSFGLFPNPLSPLSTQICPRNGCPTNCRTIWNLGFLSFGLFSNPLSPLSDKICPRHYIGSNENANSRILLGGV